jgi:hypothetical protein
LFHLLDAEGVVDETTELPGVLLILSIFFVQFISKFLWLRLQLVDFAVVLESLSRGVAVSLLCTTCTAQAHPGGSAASSYGNIQQSSQTVLEVLCPS